MRKILKPKPFVRWAGGKRQVIHFIFPFLPKKFNNYYEPFVGGGALLFECGFESKKIILNDINKDLINSYHYLSKQMNLEPLFKKLDNYSQKNSKAYYYKVRNKHHTVKNKLNRIASFLYLNKVCFNGLYRENSKGQFNVPFNGNTSKKLFDYNNLNNVSRYLRNNEVLVFKEDFRTILKNVKKGDFVYLDPPYDSKEDKPKSFTKYASADFDKIDQLELRNLCLELDKNGVYFMLSNHNTIYINELYKGLKFNVKVIEAKRSINSDPLKRGKVEEVLIYNYD